MTVLTSTQHAIGRATIIIFFLSIVAKVLAMLKEIFVAAVFGTSAILDAFNIAYGFPGIMVLTLTAILSSAFVPLYIEWHSISQEQAQEKFCSLFYVSILFFGVLTGLFFILAPWLYPLFGYGLDSIMRREVVILGRLLMLFFIFECIAIIPSAYLNARKHFFHLYFSMILPNVSVIVCLLIFRYRSIYALVWGVVVGAFLRFCYLLVVIGNLGVSLSPWRQWNLQGITKLLILALPLLGSELIANVNIFIDQVMATELSDGAVSTLRYAYRVNDIPIQLIIMALSKAILPFLSEMAVERKGEALREMFFFVVTVVGILSIPISIIMILHAEEIVRILFFRGAFGEESVFLTAKTLQCYSVGLFFYAYSFINGTFFTAMQDMKPLFYMGCVSVVLNIVFNIIGMKWIGVAGIALSTSANLFVVCSVFIVLLRRRLHIDGFKRLVRNITVILVNSGLMILAYFILKELLWKWHYVIRFMVSVSIETLICAVGIYAMRTVDIGRFFDIVFSSLPLWPRKGS
ncbi:MAG: oligosaccharide flippase family protein [Syntrophobacterales bacterium]|nr:oligosaccharide flippase family protein [Syntrophobacterales bacterium]